MKEIREKGRRNTQTMTDPIKEHGKKETNEGRQEERQKNKGDLKKVIQ
jgi:hypothetical protein